MTNLFQRGSFRLASGIVSPYKIECDALTADDLDTIALLISERVPKFNWAEGVPTGGLRLAEHINKYATDDHRDPVLIVDDVWTTGSSMTTYRNRFLNAPTIGAVIFARNKPEPWVTSLFLMA